MIVDRLAQSVLRPSDFTLSCHHHTSFHCRLTLRVTDAVIMVLLPSSFCEVLIERSGENSGQTRFTFGLKRQMGEKSRVMRKFGQQQLTDLFLSLQPSRGANLQVGGTHPTNLYKLDGLLIFKITTKECTCQRNQVNSGPYLLNAF